MIEENIERLIKKYALQNAIRYGGIAKAGPVLSKVLAERPDMKKKVKELLSIINIIIKKINELPPSKKKIIFDQIWQEQTTPIIFRQEAKRLPPLPNVEKYNIIHVRFCPNPDGALHLGGLRAAILCDEYAKMYDGKLTLRFDDTDPRTKSPIPEAYDWIIRDLEWQGIVWHNKVYQSDRLEIYYDYTKQLIDMGAAYVCTCKPTDFRKLILVRKTCPCRNLSSKEHLARWMKMLKGVFNEGEAVVRIKTDVNHPNPAVREWPALRIIDTNKFPHPRMGNKYRVWPLFAFCCGIDDHDLQISHIIRGKEHLTNSVRQHFLYDYLKWEYPEAIHYGRFKIDGSVLSKSKIREGIAKGFYKGWDDPRLGTLRALRKRGFLSETIRRVVIEKGPKPVDVTISWDNIKAINRKLIDSLANRYFFVTNPIKLIVNNVERIHISKLSLHPNNPKGRKRTLKVKPKNGLAYLMISKKDAAFFELEQIVRLIGLFNVISLKHTDKQIKANYHTKTYEKARSVGAQLIQWLPYGTGIKTSVVMPDASTLHGLAEDSCKRLKVDDIIQFERFGFVRIENVKENNIVAYYTH